MLLCDVNANCNTRKSTLIRSAMLRRLSRQNKLMEVLKSKLDETQLQLRELKNRLRQNICERDHAAAEADLRSLIEQPSHCLPFPSERQMLIVGVALKDLPPPGTTLTFDKLKVLAMVPGL